MPLKDTNTIVLEGIGNEAEFCAAVTKWRQDGLNFDARNRDRGVEDTRYAAGYQWPIDDYKWRTDNNIPAMTFNMVPTLMRHRLAARARKRIGPRILPLSPGPKYEGIARIREGLIRNIERRSGIPRVDAMVSQNQIIAGLAHYEIAIEYANSDVFETDIVIRTDRNPWNVIWDPLATDPTGRDARWVIKETTLEREDFKKMFPQARAVDFGENPANETTYPMSIKAGPEGVLGDWVTQDTIRIAIVWTMHTKKGNIALLTNGDVVEIGDVPPEDFTQPDGAGGFHTVVVDRNGKYKVRESGMKYAKGTLTNGMEILGEPYEMQIDRVPIVRVPGWEIQVADRVERFGMITFAKDALTFFNYVKSDRIERIVYRNRAAYTAQEDALSSEQQKMFANAHKLRGGVLKYRGLKPEQVEPPVVDQAAIIETQAAQQSIYEIFDIRPGLVGMEGSTPPSGIALEHQMNIADSGGMIYDESLEDAKREVYNIINQLLPVVYDSPRIEKIIGEDGKAQDAFLSDPENPESVDLTSGKYATDVSTGPSAETQRVQAIEFHQTMFNANPELMGLVAPELLELLNIPGSDKLVKALRERAGMGEESEATPEQQAMALKMQQMQEAMAELEFRSAQLEVEKKEAEVQAKLADAEAKRATAEASLAHAQERMAKIETEKNDSLIKIEEMERRVDLLISQTEKVYAEIAKINATPVTQPNGGNQ